ncbi:MAG: hypothetical protein ACK2UH_09970 [Candidatus Promineifilaceae bacterium]
MLRSSRLTSELAFLPLIVLLAACVPTEVEPSLSGGPTVIATALGGSPEATASPPATPQHVPTPFPTATASPSPGPSPTARPTVAEQGLLSPTPTAWDQGLPPIVTPTPVPPPPGLVYNLEGQLWRVDEDWQPVMLGAMGGDVLSPDGQRALRIVDGDVWLIALPGGQRFNLTGNSGRVHCCPQFWSGRPETIVFGSWSADEEVMPSNGHLSSVNVDLSDYPVLDEEHLSNANHAPSPDGRTIAYDRTFDSWLYDWEGGPRPLDPADYGLDNVARIAGPSWSPDGGELAWTVAVTGGGWRIAVAIFDLEAGTAKLLHPYENIGRGGWFGPPAWSPDGRRIAFVTQDADPAVRGTYVIEVDTGAEIFVGAGIRPLWSPDGRWLLVNPMDPNETGPWLVEVGTWYSLQMYLPPGAQAVAWLP